MTTEPLVDLAIALNASPLVGREPSCRLASEPEIWLGARGGDIPEIAAGLRVSATSLRQARRCALQATAIARAERERARALECTIVSRYCAAYPRQLLDLELPPPALYVVGQLPHQPALSMVGSRKSDPYGIEAAETFAGELAAAGLTVVSGLALGVDSAAHRGAIAVGGKTVAVLGCGIDVDYPRSNRRLRARIARNGALVSEFPIGTSPEPYHFPIRNRIIAALGCGTLVVRGTPKSGSLITAGFALELGRLVWAIPGNVFEAISIGPNSLIRDGAHPVQSSTDLFETLPANIQIALERKARQEADPERGAPERSDLARLFHAIPAGKTASVSTLVEGTGLGLDAVLGLLVELEIMGFLARYPGPVWGRSGVPGAGGRE